MSSEVISMQLLIRRSAKDRYDTSDGRPESSRKDVSSM